MKKSKLLIAPLLILSIASFLVFAEEPKQDFQTWLDITAKRSPTKRLHLFLQYNPRFQENSSHFGNHLLRSGLTFDVTDHFQIGGGYTWQRNFMKPDESDDEHQIHQDVAYHTQSKNKKWSFNGRVRMEERILEGLAAGKSIQDLMVARLRLMARLQRQVYQGKRVLKDGSSRTLSVFGQEEFWGNLNSVKNGPQRGYDMNWYFTGLNFGVNKALNFDTGYMLIHVNNHKKKADNLNHVMMFTMSYSF